MRNLRRTCLAGLMAALTLTACTNQASEPGGSASESESASASASATGAPAACEVSLAQGASTLAVSFEGTDYDVRVYAPAGLGDANPVVLDLHGSSSNGVLQAQVSGLDAVADANGFIVVEPVGVLEAEAFQEMPEGSWAWNVPGVPTTAGEYPPADARDDVAFLEAVVEQVGEAGCADPARTFATGYSGGGRMASALACERPGLVAAIAPVDGLRAGRAFEDDLSAVDPATCTPGQPVSVITFHGTEDEVNPYPGNGDPRWGYSVETAVQQWATIDECDGNPSVGTADGVTTTTYAACAEGTEVVSVVIKGANHVWPGTQADQSFFGETEWGVDASEIMWDFFAEHARG